MAIVLDGHCTVEGIFTPLDILTAIACDLPERYGEDDPDAVRRDDGSWLLDSRMAVDEVERTLSLHGMADTGDFETLAGLVLSRRGHIPGPRSAARRVGNECDSTCRYRGSRHHQKKKSRYTNYNTIE